MKKIYCDRCGKEVFYNINKQTIFPMYKIAYFPLEREFDLCYDCQKELDSLITKEFFKRGKYEVAIAKALYK